jgi:excisionase family DNA binding protein
MAQPPLDGLTTTEVAARINLSTGAVRGLINGGQFPNAYKDGHIWRIPKSDVDAWLVNRPTDSFLDNPTRWQHFRNRPYIFWPSVVVSGLAAIALFIFAAISAGADFGPFQDQLYKWGLTYPFESRQEDEILIVIADFYTGESNRRSAISE